MSVDLRDVPPELLLGAAAVALVIALVQTARIALRGVLGRRRLALRFARAAAGEVRAEELLTRLGYAVVGRQVSVSYPVAVDGAVVAVDLRADYIVDLGARRFVAEVKTGRAAPRIDTPATRRQLLEYRVAFDVDGVLLVDVEADRVHSVVFPRAEPPGAAPGAALAWAFWLAAGALMGFAAAAALHRAP